MLEIRMNKFDVAAYWLKDSGSTKRPISTWLGS